MYGRLLRDPKVLPQASPALGMPPLPPAPFAAAVANAATASAAGAGGPRPASTEMLNESGPLLLAAPAAAGSDTLCLNAGPASFAASIRQARMLSGTELSISMLSCREGAGMQGRAGKGGESFEAACWVSLAVARQCGQVGGGQHTKHKREAVGQSACSAQFHAVALYLDTPPAARAASCQPAALGTRHLPLALQPRRLPCRCCHRRAAACWR